MIIYLYGRNLDSVGTQNFVWVKFMCMYRIMYEHYLIRTTLIVSILQLNFEYM